MSEELTYDKLPSAGNINVFLDISIGDVKRGRVIIELFKDHVPKTVENFRALCTGEKGNHLHYKNSIFFKAVPECIVQGGDIINNDGSGGESIYGPFFEDENLKVKHSVQGLLSMANCGEKNTNNSQFCITLGPALHLDEHHVVFGRVVKGFNIINEISWQDLGPGERPKPECKIYDCGELRPDEDWNYCDNDYEDVYPPYPQDWEFGYVARVKASEVLVVARKIKDAGNQLLRRGDLVYAYQKYLKALRYIDWHVNNYPEDQDFMMQTRGQTHLNAALACLKLSNFKEAICHCNQVPDIETNAKALYRRAIANKGINNHEAALRDLERALLLAPNESVISTEISQIRQFLIHYRQAERLRWNRAFNA